MDCESVGILLHSLKISDKNLYQVILQENPELHGAKCPRLLLELFDSPHMEEFSTATSDIPTHSKRKETEVRGDSFSNPSDAPDGAIQKKETLPNYQDDDCVITSTNSFYLYVQLHGNMLRILICGEATLTSLQHRSDYIIRNQGRLLFDSSEEVTLSSLQDKIYFLAAKRGRLLFDNGGYEYITNDSELRQFIVSQFDFPLLFLEE
mmetsp:Transcript_9525/g.11763  ORF Transcript_9525/g.11763 Transcript_9525/m.11763 type:complete len:207 (-) Transcript_9525:120-740(-)